MNWKDLLVWGYATDIEEIDNDSQDTVNINITIEIGEDDGN